ncbi:MAG TPA: hypothetical protein VFR09_01695 [Alphaproteobacteria bacterium]|nr:hypothetical protein [Alphaproteobacteria bacterium]
MKREFAGYSTAEAQSEAIGFVHILQFLQTKGHAENPRGRVFMTALELNLRFADRTRLCPDTGTDLLREIYMAASRPTNAHSPFCKKALELLAPFDFQMPKVLRLNSVPALACGN